MAQTENQTYVDADVVVEADPNEAPTPSDFEDVDDDELLPMYPANAPKSRTPTLMAKERRQRALSLKLNGASYEQIAEQLNYASANSAYQAIRTEILNTKQESAGELKAIQFERLNHMLLVLQPQVLSGDKGAIQTALSIMDRMNTLMGVTSGDGTAIASITNNTVIMIEGDEDQYIERLKELSGHSVPESMREELQRTAIQATVVESPPEDVETDSE